METKPLFSVVIAHYNQPEMVCTAISSVLKQDYPNVELILADDCSRSLDPEGLERFVSENRAENLRAFRIVRTQTNGGTVKNLNHVMPEIRGEYVMFFAADDALYDSEVLTKFADALDTLPETALCATAQCLMMDETLKVRLWDFTDPELAASIDGNSQAQFGILVEKAFYGLGASAFRKRTIEACGGFDERYKLVEDWPFYLRNTREGRAVYFFNFCALCHREGGVSHNLSVEEPPTVRLFRLDMMAIYENEILPHLRGLPLAQQARIVNEYESISRLCKEKYAQGSALSRLDRIRMNPALELRRKLWEILARKAGLMYSARRTCVLGLVLWMITGSLGIQCAQACATLFGMYWPAWIVTQLTVWLLPAVFAVAGIIYLSILTLSVISGLRAMLR